MDEGMALLPPLTRLVYIALWNAADDEGRLRANPQYLKGALFPYDDFDIAPHLESLRTHGKLSEYSVRAQTYAVINNFTKHQRINRPTASKLPAPPDNLADIQHTAKPHGGLSEDSVRTHPLNREQGTGNRELINTPPNPQGNSVCEGLVYWNERTGQKRRSSAIKKSILARVKEFSLDEVKQVIDWAVSSRDERAEFLRGKGLEPETIFRAGNFEKYLERSNRGQRVAKAIERSTPDGWVGPALGVNL